MHTNRWQLVGCPACQGERGEWQPGWAGDRWSGCSADEWVECDVCAGHGEVERVERLAWFIREAWAAEAYSAARPAPAPAAPLVWTVPMLVAVPA